ncbi:HalOD1 output domain-containing protein [Natrinema sp. CGMCC1.2065]|uniref:HalOD1 output domain-containing protein n=1 Tax=Natrinema sp. CGMCC1.2065 TaxID=3445767 RepID=UPI003F49DF84
MTGATLDYHTDSVSLQVIDAIADATNTDASDLEPLYDVVDPEALDQLFQSGSGAAVRVEFEYHGMPVEVRGDGTVTVNGTVHGSR